MGATMAKGYGSNQQKSVQKLGNRVDGYGGVRNCRGKILRDSNLCVMAQWRKEMQE